MEYFLVGMFVGAALLPCSWISAPPASFPRRMQLLTANTDPHILPVRSTYRGA